MAGEEVSPAASIADPGQGAKVAREMAATKGKRLVIVESPAKAKTIAGLPRARLRRRVVDRPHPRPPPERVRSTREVQGREVGPPRRQRRQRVRADLRRRPAEAEGRLRVEGEAQGRRRVAARDGRRPRGRGDRLAPRAGAEAEGPGAPDGLPRDHPPGDRARARRDPQHRPEPRRRPGSAPRARPAVRLRGLAGALAEGDAGTVGRARPVGRDPARRRARTRALGVHRRGLLGHRRDARPGCVHGAALVRRRSARRAGPRLRTRRRAEEQRRGAARRGRCPPPGGLARRRRVPGCVGRREAVHASPRAAVHDLDVATGGEPQAAALVAADDARRAAPVRERLHHLHAHRLDDAVGVGTERGPRPGPRTVRSRFGACAAAPVRAEGEERAGGSRGRASRGRPLPHAGRRRPRALGRRVPPVRPDLEANRRLADGGCARADRLGADRRRRGRRTRRRVLDRRAP